MQSCLTGNTVCRIRPSCCTSNCLNYLRVTFVHSAVLVEELALSMAHVLEFSAFITRALLEVLDYVFKFLLVGCGLVQLGGTGWLGGGSLRLDLSVLISFLSALWTYDGACVHENIGVGRSLRLVGVVGRRLTRDGGFFLDSHRRQGLIQKRGCTGYRMIKGLNLLKMLLLNISKHSGLVDRLVVISINPMYCWFMIAGYNGRVMIGRMITAFLLHSITVTLFLCNVRTVQILIIRDTFGVFYMLGL
jgi:hypothetical protein